MKKTLICAVVAMVLAVSGVASGTVIIVDPDTFPAGTVLNNAYAGVTLTALGDPGVLLNSDVVTVASTYASTGSNLFGNNDARGFGDCWGDGYFDWLQVDFAGGATTVSLDFITNNNEGDDNAVLRAFDSFGVEVDSDGPYYVPGPAGTYQTLTVSAPYIARIVAEWDEINRIENGMLDYLVYTPVPEPTTICLFGLGGLGLLRKKRHA